MAVTLEAKKLAAEIMVAALEAKTFAPSGSTEERAEEIAKAFKVIVQAVGEPGLNPPPNP